MRVEIDWTWIDDDDDPLWQESQCLYAYADPDTDELVYIGKADYQTVGQRLRGPHKEDLLDDLGLDSPAVLQGDVLLESGRRLTSELLGEIEALLIMELQPPGNRAYTQSRPSRPGMTVSCVGDWQWEPAVFKDE